ncbi:MAG: glycosyltransferase [Acidobacteriota bacterium]
MITCKILCHSNSSHISQVCTGFALLHKAGEIALSQECNQQNYFDATKAPHLRDAKHAHLTVIVNAGIKFYYDCHDSYEINEAAAGEVDCYFKRSYAPTMIPDSLRAKVFPLGLNYALFSGKFDRFEQQRLAAFEPELNNESYKQQFRPTVENMHAVPNGSHDPRVLFITRAWDSNYYSSESLNETRARCIELLREKFGNHFLGGFVHSDYAVRNYPHVLLQDNGISAKEDFVKLLSLYPICIATTGLHGSIGWKLAEYVAFSRAIVSERLNYQVPGDFKPGKNYLEFDEPEEVVALVDRLMTNDALRHAMMKANHDYYLNYLKPDAMIRRTLRIGLSNSK